MLRRVHIFIDILLCMFDTFDGAGGCGGGQCFLVSGSSCSVLGQCARRSMPSPFNLRWIRARGGNRGSYNLQAQHREYCPPSSGTRKRATNCRWFNPKCSQKKVGPEQRTDSLCSSCCMGWGSGYGMIVAHGFVLVALLSSALVSGR
eukprot:4841027-Amphidinium_carterae.1